MSNSRSPNPRIASVLTSVCCGLGHIYCGQAGRGLILISLNYVGFPLLIVAGYWSGISVVFGMFLATLAFMLAVSIWAWRDVSRLAKSQQSHPPVLQEYQHPLVYGALILPVFPMIALLVIFFRTFVGEAFFIPTQSMAPTLVPGDRILVDKRGIATQSFSRGALVVFRNPQDRRIFFVKRIVAVSGDQVELNDNICLVNGEPAISVNPQIGNVPKSASTPDDHSEKHPSHSEAITLRPSEYYLLGDNREKSLDSRTFGPVPHGDIIGVVKFNYYPGDRWSRFGSIR